MRARLILAAPDEAHAAPAEGSWGSLRTQDTAVK
jgi:hypothetical protein